MTRAQEVVAFGSRVVVGTRRMRWRPLRELNPGRRNDNPA